MKIDKKDSNTKPNNILGDEYTLFRALLPLLPEVGNFMEIGSRNGRDHCYSLYKNGWSGFCVEANPDIAWGGLLETYGHEPRVKTFNYFISDKRGLTKFCIENTPNSGVSSAFYNRATGIDSGISRPLKKIIEVPSIPLIDFWKENDQPKIDLLMLDIEGYDASVLLSTDFSIFSPKFIMAETGTCYYHIEPHEKSNGITVWNMIIEHMKKFGYELIMTNNDFDYKKRYCPELMDIPMNGVWVRRGAQ